MFGASIMSGCQDNDSILFVRGAMHLQSGSCKPSGSESAELLTNGVYDVAFGEVYMASLLIGNQLASRGEKERTRTETSSIRLEGAEVTLRLPNGRLLDDPFTSPGAGFINVGTGENAGYGSMGIVVIPKIVIPKNEKGETSETIKSTDVEGGYVIAEIRVFGKTLGGQELESGLFKFPISVCTGCLIRYPASAIDADDLCKTTTEAEAAQPCNLGQDDPISCSACAGNFDICRDPSLNR